MSVNSNVADAFGEFLPSDIELAHKRQKMNPENDRETDDDISHNVGDKFERQENEMKLAILRVQLNGEEEERKIKMEHGKLKVEQEKIKLNLLKLQRMDSDNRETDDDVSHNVGDKFKRQENEMNLAILRVQLNGEEEERKIKMEHGKIKVEQEKIKLNLLKLQRMDSDNCKIDDDISHNVDDKFKHQKNELKLAILYAQLNREEEESQKRKLRKEQEKIKLNLLELQLKKEELLLKNMSSSSLI